ncbi:MAG: hypothetical protein ACP5UZ_07625 [Thermoplasmata archaeon]
MNFRQVIYDSLFILIIEISLLFVYLKGPIPFYWGFPFTNPIIHYFYTSINQFNIVLIIPRLPQLIFGTADLKISMFLGLSVVWVPSIFLSVWLTRVLLSEMHLKVYLYLSYLPILFVIFNPHTLYELFSFDATHMFAGMSQIFFMYASILSGIIFYFNGRWKFLIIALISILLVNYQTFPLSYFIVFSLFLLFSPLQSPILSHLLRSAYLICLSAFVAFIDLFVGFSIVPGNQFPYGNLNVPSFYNTIDPNYRVILIVNEIHKNLLSVLTFQNFINGPFYPEFMPKKVYFSILLAIGLMTFIPLFILLRGKRRLVLIPYLSFISVEILDVFGNPTISLVWPQQINIFNVVSLLFNNNTVFYYPLKILASLLFLFSSISIAELLRPLFRQRFRLNQNEKVEIDAATQRRHVTATMMGKVTTLAVVALVMISPLATYSIYSTPRNQGYSTMEVYYAYFDGVKDPSIYFQTSSNNPVMEKIMDSSIFGYVENPEISPEQSYPMSLAMSMYSQVEPPMQPEFVNYIMNTFNYNYIVTDSQSFAHLLSDSVYFSLALHYNWLYIFKVSKEDYNSKDVLLTSSVTQLISFVNFHKSFPEWIYSPYLLNLSSLNSIFRNDSVFSPFFVTPYSYFIHVGDLSVIVPARYTDNTYYSNTWEMGYLVTVAQATWSQNIQLLNNYQYQNDINELYGLIYTSEKGALLHFVYDAPKGSYFAIARVLLSNVGGILNISLNGMQHSISTASSNASYFEYVPIGNVSSDGSIQVTITNGEGFNSVNAILLIPEQTFLAFNQRFEQYPSMSIPPLSLPTSPPLARYPISIVSNLSDPQLVYEQRINVSSRETNLINSNWTNIAFEYADGSIIPSWIQCYSSTMKYAIIWLRIYGEINRTIYMLVYNSTTNLMSQTGFLGEAPSLSPIYGEYFNAPVVFGSGNAWDWRSSLEGWSSTNASATYVSDGIHVYNGTNGGIYLQRDIPAGSAFSVYGWTENGTVIQMGGYSNENHTDPVGIGWTGGNGFYYLQYYPAFGYNVSVPEEKYLNYTFTIEILYNNTADALINGTAYRYPQDPYPAIYNVSSIFVREGTNDMQYYEYAFLRTLPVGNLMPYTTIYWGD